MKGRGNRKERGWEGGGDGREGVALKKNCLLLATTTIQDKMNT